MNHQNPIEVSQQFVEIGQQLYTLVTKGSTIARQSQQGWYEFVARLLTDGTAFEGVQRPLTEAVALYNQHQSPRVTLETVQYYLVAKVVRAVKLEPEALANQWYFICHGTEIPNPGDFITVQMFQEPVVAIRQGDGSIQVFLNVCPHRQCLVFERNGCIKGGKSELCPYHGWAFSEDGHCTNAPGANRGEFGEDFDLKDYSLRSFETRIDSNQGVFARLIANGDGDEPITTMPPADIQVNGQNIGVAIANLLQDVSPGYTEGIIPCLPEPIRLWIKIGYLGEQLKHVVAGIAQRQGLTPEAVLSSVNLDLNTEPDRNRDLLLESVMRELRQALLMVEAETISLKLEDILEEVKHTQISDLCFGVEADGSSLSSSEATTDEPEQNRRIALPIWTYGDWDLFALEIKHLIAPTWQFVCHVNEIPQPHQYTWLDIVGERAYVIRTANGDLFAGKLKHIDGRQQGPDFEGARDYGLDPIDIEVFYGFVFIRLLRQGPSLKEIWHQPGLLDPYKLEEMQPIGGSGQYDISVEVDYKLLWENFLEDYHFPMMHKGLTLRFGVSSDCEGINGMIIPMRDPASPKLNPVERKYYDCAKTLARHDWEREKELQRFAAEHQFLPETLCYSAFCSMAAQEEMPMPFSLSVFPEHVQTFSIVPGGPRESRFHVRSYGHRMPPNPAEADVIKGAQLANIQLLAESLQEDIRVNYITQDSVSSQLFEKLGVFSIAEWDVAKFQEAVQMNIPVTSSPRKPPKLLNL
ncbi:Rieske 2Fe-2S domain-containing protein [Moorena sp. SIO4G3]|uniref:Rieske 2Fe-2S domain-containing protein n=1 Tax=Moorena sp. SIO4G3 TaxID=2607821 RepID=UPI00142A5D14|nr:Rieske 2Fe-2S domain-containing protein [Moorena sp. SIO4G3]NEO76295.1 Rieske 2Fe-2S domain-containing protein [Moorena sp. SIO4G3]